RRSERPKRICDVILCAEVTSTSACRSAFTRDTLRPTRVRELGPQNPDVVVKPAVRETMRGATCLRIRERHPERPAETPLLKEAVWLVLVAVGPGDDPGRAAGADRAGLAHGPTCAAQAPAASPS